MAQVLGDHELEPMSRSLLAAPHSMCELRSLLCKTVITVADILFKPLPHVQTVLYCLSCGLIFYFHARFVSVVLRVLCGTRPAPFLPCPQLPEVERCPQLTPEYSTLG